jgi:hypothetical protein
MLLQYKPKISNMNPVVVVQAAPMPVQVESRNSKVGDELAELKRKNQQLEQQVHKLMQQLQLSGNFRVMSIADFCRFAKGAGFWNEGKGYFWGGG